MVCQLIQDTLRAEEEWIATLVCLDVYGHSSTPPVGRSLRGGRDEEVDEDGQQSYCQQPYRYTSYASPALHSLLRIQLAT